MRLVMDEGEVGHGCRIHSIFGSLRRRSRCRNWSKSWTETTVWRLESRWRRCIWRRRWIWRSSRRSQGKGWVAVATVLLNILLLLLLCLFWFRGLGLWIWGFIEGKSVKRERREENLIWFEIWEALAYFCVCVCFLIRFFFFEIVFLIRFKFCFLIYFLILV